MKVVDKDQMNSETVKILTGRQCVLIAHFDSKKVELSHGVEIRYKLKYWQYTSTINTIIRTLTA